MYAERERAQAWEREEEAAAAAVEPELEALQLKVTAPSMWQRHFDDAAGRDYFFNLESGLTTWERPEGLVVE